MDFFVYLIFLWLKLWTKIIPLPAARVIAKFWGLFFYYFIPIRKQTAVDNLKLCFPGIDGDKINRITKGAYINVMTVIVEFFYMQRLNYLDFKREIRVTNPRLIHEKLEQGKGLILVCAHFGNWEWMAYGVSLLCGEPFHVIVKEQTNKVIDKKINIIREHYGNKMIEMKNSLRESLSLLKENKIIGILGDQSAPKDNSVKVDFFVKDVPAFGGAAAFAIKTGCPVLFGVPFRNTDGTYTITLIEVNTDNYKDYNEPNIRKVTQAHADLLKDAIVSQPDHWLWFHRRFKHVI